MNKKIVPAFPKNTSANTQYWELNDQDRAHLLEWMIRFLADIQEECTANADLQREYYRRRPNSFPKGRLGPNSIASMLGGIVNQLFAGRDLSTPMLDATESLFDIIVNYYDDLEAIKFDRRLWNQ
jgi:hypothetical protein